MTDRLHDIIDTTLAQHASLILDDETNWYRCGCGAEVDLDRFKEDAHRAHQTDMLVARLGIDHQRDAWVNMTRQYVDGTPFGGWQEVGETYHCAPMDRGHTDGDAPLFRVKALESDEVRES